jgi:hypothetical protein
MEMHRWWGYLHTDGTIHVKRYFGDPRDIEEARMSEFCIRVVPLFYASNRLMARSNILDMLDLVSTKRPKIKLKLTI